MPYMPINRRLVLVVAGLFLLFGYQVVAMRGQKRDADRLVVGVSAECPPFTFMEHNELMGFDIDIMREIGSRLSKQVEFKQMPFASLLPALQLGLIQVIAAGLTATPERAKRVLFTQSYLERDPLLLISRKAFPIRSLAAARGKPVVVNEGYTADLYISSLPGHKVMRLNRSSDAVLALLTGRACAYVSAFAGIKNFFNRYGNRHLYIVALPGTNQNTALAVTPHNHVLRDKLARALQAMQADGTLALLQRKWEML